jgi:hypothetical protein
MPAQQQKAKNKGRKIGRWLRKPSYKRYLAESRWLKNKARRLARYMRKHPNWTPTNLDPVVQGLIARYSLK